VLYIDNDNLGLNLNGSKSFESVRAASFYGLGERSGYGGREAVDRAAAAVSRLMATWYELSDLLPGDQFTALNKRIVGLPLISDAL
jgi:hypothetical protein